MYKTQFYILIFLFVLTRERSVLYQKAPDELDTAEDPVCYFIKDGVLMRKWQPSDVSADEEWSFRYQIIVPKPYRSEILSLAHDTPLSGHLGSNKQNISKNPYSFLLARNSKKCC